MGVDDDVLLLVLVQGCFERGLVVRMMLAGLNFCGRGAGNVVAVEERGQAVLEAVNEIARVAHSVGVGLLRSGNYSGIGLRTDDRQFLLVQRLVHFHELTVGKTQDPPRLVAVKQLVSVASLQAETCPLGDDESERGSDDEEHPEGP